MRAKILAALLAASALGGATAAQAAGEIIAPVAATIDAGGPGEGSIADTFNQNGLNIHYTSGVTNFDSYIALHPMHSFIFSGNEWFSQTGTTSAQVTYDLGSVMSIDRLALWNEESSGIGHLILLDGSMHPFLTVDPPDNPLADYPATVYSFGAISTRYVTFQMSNCPQPDPGSYPSCAIGEVAFRSATNVPEPATWGLMIAGLGLAGAMLRRRREVLA